MADFMFCRWLILFTALVRSLSTITSFLRMINVFTSKTRKVNFLGKNCREKSICSHINEPGVLPLDCCSLTLGVE